MSCPPIGVYSADELEEQFEMAMISFAEGNVEIIKKDDKTIIFDLSRILQWYRADFHNNKSAIPGMVFICMMMGEDAERIKIVEEYFDRNEELLKMARPLDKNGLMIWNKENQAARHPFSKGVRLNGIQYQRIFLYK